MLLANQGRSAAMLRYPTSILFFGENVQMTRTNKFAFDYLHPLPVTAGF